jgi:hypothetical protein
MTRTSVSVVFAVSASLLGLQSHPSLAGEPDPIAEGDPAQAEALRDPAPGPEAAAPDDNTVIVIDQHGTHTMTTQGLTSANEVILTSGSARGTAEEFLVLPTGLDVGGRLRTVTASDSAGIERIKLTDLALFDLHAEWAFRRHYELDVAVSVVPKQPAAMNAPVFQGGSLAVRRDLIERTAIAVSGSATPLLGLDGVAFGGAAFVMHKHRLNEFVTFAFAGGANAVLVRATRAAEMAPGIATTANDRPFLIEGAGHVGVLVRADGHWGGWASVGYALPAYHRGRDPVSGMAIDPPPRLDLHIGNAVRLARRWDLTVELSILDRGDLDAPATRLPLLDGGFDQIQFIVGVNRRLELKNHESRSDGVSDPMIQL